MTHLPVLPLGKALEYIGLRTKLSGRLYPRLNRLRRMENGLSDHGIHYATGPKQYFVVDMQQFRSFAENLAKKEKRGYPKGKVRKMPMSRRPATASFDNHQQMGELIMFPSR